jgi:multiple antibiotic resistance protein
MELVKAASLLFILLNPFLMSVYLISLIQELSLSDFNKVMIRAHIISGSVFIVFAILGDHIFEDVFKVRFASFQIFGGIVFLLIGIRSVFSGQVMLIETRGNPELIAGAVTMPFMIAPGTLSACVIIGANLAPVPASLAVIMAILASLISIILFKFFYDSVKKRNERLMSRYVEIAGRAVALFTGTYAVEMIVRGIQTWMKLSI